MGRVTASQLDHAAAARVEQAALEAVKARARVAQARIAAAHPDASADELLDVLRRDEFFRELHTPDPLLVRIANAIASGHGHAPLSRDREDRSGS